MCKDIYGFARSDICPIELQDVATLIEPINELSISSNDGLKATALSRITYMLEEDSYESDSPEITNMTCKCVNCCIPTPSPISGRQRIDTVTATRNTQQTIDTEAANQLVDTGAAVHDMEVADATEKNEIALKTKSNVMNNKKGPRRTRIVGKQAVRTKNTKEWKDQPITLPISVNNRSSSARTKETYIVQATVKHRYIACMTESHHANYKTIVYELADLIRQRTIGTPAEAQAWLNGRR